MFRSLILGVAVVLTLAASASAGQVIRDTIHDERTFDIVDYCDVAGLTVRITQVLDMRVKIAPRGRDGFVYFLSHATQTETITNLANGRSLTSAATVNEKDKQITDNGDGTLTILIMATGNAVLFGEDGMAIARGPGQLRFEILVDDAGTPSDPSDDVVTRLGVVKGSTGRNDDFCAAAVPALTGATS